MYLSTVKTPVINVIIGEGMSGGALGIGVGDQMLMLENSVFSVISPEGCAAILWNDARMKEQTAQLMQINPQSLLQHGLIDQIIPEGKYHAAHVDWEGTFDKVGQYLITTLHALQKQDLNHLVALREKNCSSMDLYKHIQTQLTSIDPEHTLTVALSGGIDSVVLTHLLKQINTHKIEAIHIHHGLQAANDMMQKHCELFCQFHDIPLHIKHIKISSLGNIEDLARKARYEAFSNHTNYNILLAQHQNDLDETLLIRLYQGRLNALPYSLPKIRKKHPITYFRPLLEVPKTAILSYAKQHQLTWIEDPTNQDVSMLRNHIRKVLAKSKELQKLAKILRCFSNLLVKFEQISTERLLPMNTTQCFNYQNATATPYLLRLWILKNTQIQISENKAADILRHFQNSSPDRQPEFSMKDHLLQRHQSYIFLREKINPAGNNSLPCFLPVCFSSST